MRLVIQRSSAMVVGFIVALIAVDAAFSWTSTTYSGWFLEPSERIYKEYSWFDDYSYHPFLAYYNKAEFEVPKQPGKFKIAILGGSFADQLYHSIRRNYKDKLALAFGKKPEDIQLINYAAGGYAQPNQWIAANLYGADVDAFISIEGFNELFTSHYTCLPEDWPAMSLRFWNLAGGSYAYYTAKVLKASVTFLRTLSRDKFFLRRPARPLYFSLSHFAAPAIARLSQIHSSIVAKRTCGEQVIEPDDHYAYRLSLWMENLKRMKALASTKTVYVFFQPNLHYKQSKPLSLIEDELRQQDLRTDYIDKWYSTAVVSFKGLDQNFIDATKVYTNVSETLYTDSCCHVNARGKELFADYLFDVIAESRHR